MGGTRKSRAERMSTMLACTHTCCGGPARAALRSHRRGKSCRFRHEEEPHLGLASPSTIGTAAEAPARQNAVRWRIFGHDDAAFTESALTGCGPTDRARGTAATL